MRKSYRNMEKKVEVKKRFEKKLLIGLLSAFAIMNFVFAGYLFSDTQSSSLEISGNNQTIQATTSLTKNLVISQTNATENITYSDSVTYVVDVNRTVNFNPTVQKTLLDQSCINYENDCSVLFSFRTPNANWQELNLFPVSLLFYGKSQAQNPPLNDGENEIKYELSCIPTSCHQNLNVTFLVEEQ